nr:hypothetical protein CFP56_03995 [Quercus suber]
MSLSTYVRGQTGAVGISKNVTQATTLGAIHTYVTVPYFTSSDIMCDLNYLGSPVIPRFSFPPRVPKNLRSTPAPPQASSPKRPYPSDRTPPALSPSPCPRHARAADIAADPIPRLSAPTTPRSRARAHWCGDRCFGLWTTRFSVGLIL